LGSISVSLSHALGISGGGSIPSHGDLRATSPSGLGCLNFYHPEMQQHLLEHAMEAGCDVRRPAEAVGLIPGQHPIVVVRSGQTESHVAARLVVGADGRNSRIRGWSGLSAVRDPACLIIAGALFEGLAIPEDAIRVTRNPDFGTLRSSFPSGRGAFVSISYSPWRAQAIERSRKFARILNIVHAHRCPSRVVL
jgi:menaquinone-9 beta-reductase